LIKGAKLAKARRYSIFGIVVFAALVVPGNDPITMSALALSLTFPLWITVNWLGEPDNGVILASYLGSLLMAGAFLAIGSCLSALSRSSVVAFILIVLVSLLFLLAGFPLVLGPLQAVLPQATVDAVSSLSFLTHFQAITRGVLDLRDVLYFVLTIAAWLFATVLVIEIRKAD